MVDVNDGIDVFVSWTVGVDVGNTEFTIGCTEGVSTDETNVGIVLLVAACSSGTGSLIYIKAMKRATTINKIAEKIATSPMENDLFTALETGTGCGRLPDSHFRSTSSFFC